MSAEPAPGRLLLVPNTLDHGNEPAPIEQVLARGVLEQAALLQHWVVEDARSARAFLKRVATKAPLVQPLQALAIVELPRPRKGAHDEIPAQVWRDLLAPAQAGHDIGLQSEAGMPAVADPGSLLVAQAHALRIPVVPLAGPSSLVLALAASGLNGQSFAFLGYLPQEAAVRAGRLREIESWSRRWRQTQLFIETPYRNQALWEAMLAGLAPSTQLAVACGLTLPHGFTRMATVAGWRQAPIELPDRLPAVFALLAH